MNPPKQPVRVLLARDDSRFTGGRVNDLAVSPDGRFLAASNGDAVTVWQLDGLLPIAAIRAPTGFGALAWAADGKVLVTRGMAGETTTIDALGNGDARTAKLVRVPLRGRTDATSIVIAADVELRDAADRRVRVLAWPAGTKKLVRVTAAPDGSTVVGVVGAPPPDRPNVLVATANVIVWNAADGKGRAIDLAGKSVVVHGFAAGKALIDLDDELAWLDLATGAPTKLGVTGIDDATLSPAGDRVAFLANGEVGVYDLATARTLWRRASGPNAMANANAVTFDGTGASVIVAGFESPTRLEATTGYVLDDVGRMTYEHPPMFAGEDHLVTGSLDHITTWDLTTARPVPARSRHLPIGAFAVAGTDVIVERGGRHYAASCYRSTYLDRWPRGTPPADLEKAIAEAETYYDLGKTKPVVPPTGASRIPVCLDSVQQLDLVHGRAIVAQGPNAAWLDLATGARTPLEASPNRVTLLGDVAITMIDDDAVVWNAAGKYTKLPIPVKDDEQVHLAQPRFETRGDGKAIAIAYGPHIFVYEPGGKHLRTIDLDALPIRLGWIGGDLVAGVDDGTTRRFGPDGKERARVPGVLDITAVSPSGKRVAAYDETGLLWLLAGDSLRRIVALHEIGDAWLAMTPNGAFDGSEDAAEALSITFAAPAHAAPLATYESTFRKPELVRKRLAGGNDDLGATLARPPRATLAPPAITGAVAKARVHVDSVTGAGEVTAYVEGREVTRATYCGASADVALDVPVAASGRLTVVARDTGGGAASAAADVAVPPSAKPELHAVVVGVGKYTRLDARWQLRADRDARALARALELMAGTNRMYAKADVTLLVDEKATRGAVDAALAKLAKLRPIDQAIVYFAGHGWRVDGKMVLLTSSVLAKSDAVRDGIAWTAIRDRLERVRGRVLVLLDACHSGAFSQDVAVANERLADGLVRRGKSGVVVFAAAKGRQFSYEVGASRGHFELAVETAAKKSRPVTAKQPPPPPEPAGGDRDTPVGLFTVAVIAAFATPAADTNRDGIIQLSELVAAVSARVKDDVEAIKQVQTPTVSRRDLVGDFAVGPRL